MITYGINRIDGGWTAAHFSCYSADILHCSIIRHTAVVLNLRSTNIRKEPLAEHFPGDRSSPIAEESQ